MMKTKFIIKGIWDNEEVFFTGFNEQSFFGIPVVKLSTSITEAKHFDSIEEVEKAYEDVSHATFKIYPVCPRCHKAYDGHPAISREDNKTEVCSACGQYEALEAFNKYYGLVN